MRIEKHNGTVRGYADIGGEIEEHVITLRYSEGKITVGTSMCLPTDAEHAKRILSCYKAAFDVAEERAELHNQYADEYVKFEHLSSDKVTIAREAWPELSGCIDAALAECDVSEWEARPEYREGDLVTIDGVEQRLTEVTKRALR